MQKVIDFYKTYDESKRLTSDNRHRLELYRKQYLYKNLLQNSKRVLQISCGTGIHTKFILDTFPDIELFASDLVPEHCQETAKLKYKNLRVFQWDCTQKKPNFIHNIDTILVEGAWYHLNKEQRQYLIANLMSLNPSLIVIDFLSELHEVQQRLLQDKKFINPENGIREPFFFDNRDDAENLAFRIYANNYNVSICPIDLDLRFGYTDLNNVPEEEFLKFVEYLNNTIRVSKDFETVNYTEHGCYIIR